MMTLKQTAQKKTLAEEKSGRSPDRPGDGSVPLYF